MLGCLEQGEFVGYEKNMGVAECPCQRSSHGTSGSVSTLCLCPWLEGCDAEWDTGEKGSSLV